MSEEVLAIMSVTDISPTSRRSQNADDSVHESPRKEQIEPAALVLGPPHAPSRETLSMLDDEPPTCQKPTSGPSILAPGQLDLAEVEPPTSPRPDRPSLNSEPTSPSAPMSARGSRANVRDTRKEVIAISRTIDFVSLASYDRGMVQECDDVHVEALKRKREDSLVCNETHVLSPTCGRAFPPAAASPQRKCLSPSEGRSQCASELGDLIPKRRKLLLSKDPARPQSSRGGHTSSPASERFASVGPHSGVQRQGSVGPLSRTGSFDFLPAGHALPPRLSASSLRLVALGFECAQGHSRMASAHGSIPESLSAFTGGEAVMRMGTPPGASNAFEAHGLLVRCPAPRRPTAPAPRCPPSALASSTFSL